MVEGRVLLISNKFFIVSDFEAQSTTALPLLTVIVPAYNERATIAGTLDAVLIEPTAKEIIIVDDGSTDETATAIASWIESLVSDQQATVRLVSLRQNINGGKGSAIRAGLEQSRGQYVVVQDADLEVHPASYAALLAPIVTASESNESIEFVIGNRRQLIRGNRLLHATGV